jgi:hypothetical protein
MLPVYAIAVLAAGGMVIVRELLLRCWLRATNAKRPPGHKLVRPRDNPLRLAGAAILMFVAVACAGRAFGVAGAVGMAALVLGVPVVTTVRRMARDREIQRLCDALDGQDGQEALRKLEERLSQLRRELHRRRDGHAAWARWVLHVSRHAASGGRPVDALRLVLALDPDRLGALRATHAQYVASFHITLGDPRAARAALATAPRPAEPPSIEKALVAVEALLEALDGDAAAVLRRTHDALSNRDDAVVRVLWQTAHAHALAATGDTSEARALLASMRAEHGDTTLRRIVGHTGPASPIALALLAEERAYR